MKIETSMLFILTKLKDVEDYSELLYAPDKYEVIKKINSKNENIFELEDDYLNKNYYNGKFKNICEKVSMYDDKSKFFKAVYEGDEYATSVLDIIHIINQVNKKDEDMIKIIHDELTKNLKKDTKNYEI